MALTVSNIPGAIQTKGGSALKAAERLSTGAVLSSPDTPHDFGELYDSKFRDKTTFTGLFNEAGDKKGNEESSRDTGFDCTLMQRDFATIDDLRNEVRGKFYIAMRVMSRTNAVNAKTQISFAFGQFQPDVEFDLPGGRVPAKFEGLILEAAISLTPGELSAWTGNTTSLPATITIPAGDWCKNTEVTTWS